MKRILKKANARQENPDASVRTAKRRGVNPRVCRAHVRNSDGC